MIGAINGVFSNLRTHTASNSSSQSKPEYYVIKSGDTLTKIASNYGLTADEFCKWVNRKKDKVLSTGEKIKLPKQAKVPEHKGIYALAREYNMDVDRFCKLNGISKNYQAKVGETFYVYRGLKNNPASSSSGASGSTSSNGFEIKALPKAGYWTVGAKEEKSVRVLFGKPIAAKSNGKIVSETIKFTPYERNTGELRGKTIMVNAGHGMKYATTPQLDMGKPDAKDENGKQIEEWRKNRDYADVLIQNLRKKGATVIFTNGDAVNACNEKRKYRCDLFVSLHCNATANRKKSGLEVFYHEGATKSKNLATSVGTTFGIPQSNVKSDNTTRFGKLGVLTNIGPKNCPSILLEMGYLTNATDIRNIDSVADRQKKMDKLTQAIVKNLK